MFTRSEKINLAATVGGPILVSAVIAWVGWSARSWVKIELDARDTKISQTYVDKVSANEIKDSIKQVSTKVEHVAEDVSEIKGQLSATKH